MGIIPIENLDDFAADITTTGVLIPDGAATVGNIDFELDEDWFALDVIAGEQYFVELRGVTVFEYDLDLVLYDSSGVFLSSYNLAFEPLVFEALETGTVFIGASSFLAETTGEYNLTASIVEDATPMI